MADAKKETAEIPAEVIAAAEAAAAAVITRGQAASAEPMDATEHVAALNKVEFGSKEHEQRLRSAYGMDREKAERIIEERGKDPTLWPYDEYERAQAFLGELDGKPRVTATKPAWKRKEV